MFIYIYIFIYLFIYTCIYLWWDVRSHHSCRWLKSSCIWHNSVVLDTNVVRVNIQWLHSSFSLAVN